MSHFIQAVGVTISFFRRLGNEIERFISSTGFVFKIKLFFPEYIIIPYVLPGCLIHLVPDGLYCTVVLRYNGIRTYSCIDTNVGLFSSAISIFRLEQRRTGQSGRTFLC
jgi:hypothetical protein